MKEFHKASDDEKLALLKAAGVAPEVPDPDAKTLFGNPKEGATKANEQAAAQYRAAMLKQHQAELGLGGEGAGAAPADHAAGAQPSMTPDGRQIKYDAQGNAFIKGPDGKPVPYVADANGNPDSPLAMDHDPDNELAEAQPDDEHAEGEESPQGQPLLAGNAPDDTAASDAEDEQDDNEQDQQTAGLMSGQYA
jgi:hypothetical protein